MNRSEIVNHLAGRFSHLTQRDADSAVTAILDAMRDAMVRGHRIEVRGFGSFSISYRPSRMGRNPRNGESVSVPARRVTKFKVGKALKDSLDQ